VIKGKCKFIPNIFTFSNMLFGLLSILLLIQSEHINKAIFVPILIFLGGAADLLDGFLARKLNAVAELGKQLDSFADIITFGVAPISLINYLSVCPYPIGIVLASLVYISAGAYRLARYNLSEFTGHYCGLPIPVAGVSLAAYSMVYPMWADFENPLLSTTVTVSFILLLSVLMISKKSIKRIV